MNFNLASRITHDTCWVQKGTGRQVDVILMNKEVRADNSFTCIGVCKAALEAYSNCASGALSVPALSLLLGTHTEGIYIGTEKHGFVLVVISSALRDVFRLLGLLSVGILLPSHQWVDLENNTWRSRDFSQVRGLGTRTSCPSFIRNWNMNSVQTPSDVIKTCDVINFDLCHFLDV